MTNGEHGMIAVDKIGTKVLFLNPETFATEVAIDGFAKTVHELLIVPATGSQPSMAYVPIFGDGMHGRIIRSITSASSICTSARSSPPSICRPISRRIRSNSGPTARSTSLARIRRRSR